MSAAIYAGAKLRGVIRSFSIPLRGGWPAARKAAWKRWRLFMEALFLLALFLQRDSGVYIQLEAISLTRDIPTGLGWLVGPFVSSIPRESLEFTLTRTREALAKIVDH